MKLIELLDRPIAFHRCLVEVTGSVNGGLLLSQAIYWQNRPTRESSDGWWYKTYEDWKEETGLSRRDFEGARRDCIEKGLLQYVVKGVPAKGHYRVNLEAVQTSLDTLCKLDCSKPANQFVHPVQTIYTKTKAETTTETKVHTRKDRGTLEQIRKFCIEECLPCSDGDWFFHKCEGNGWTNGGKPIKDWKSTIRSWKAAGYMASQRHGRTTSGKVSAYEAVQQILKGTT